MPNNKGKRSANGSGTIRHRADGSWEGIMTIGTDPATGKPKKKSVYGKTQKEVRQKMTDLRQQLDNQTYADDQNLTFAQWADIWLNDYSGDWKPYTKNNYASLMRCGLVPALGKIKLHDLKPLTIQRMINNMSKEGRASTSINSYRNALHACLQKAVDLQYIAKNPCDKVTAPPYATSGIKPLPRSALHDFTTLADTTPFGDELFVCLYTGLRIGELMGLTWPSVNFEEGTLTIDKQYLGTTHINIFSTTKSGRTRVIIPPPSVMRRLRSIYENQQKIIAVNKDFNPQQFVFVNKIGQPITYCRINAGYKKIVTKLGYPKARIHDLRHTYATISLELGENLKAVSESLGHSSVSVTGNVYAHVTDRMKKDSANRLQSLIDDKE